MFLVLTLVPVSGVDPDPAAARLFDAWADVFAAAGRHALGDEHDAWSAEELRGLERDTTTLRPAVAAVEDGVVVGGGGLVVPRLENARVAWVHLATHPAHRRAGVGSALLRWAEEVARDHGRTVLVTETHWLGAVDADPEEGWADRRGFTPAQAVLRSDLELGPPAPAPAVAAGYRLESHLDGMPDADLEDRALLMRRMSTDAPLGALDLEEEQWDAARVRAEHVRAAGMGRRVVTTVVRHLESGRLVGFTTVQVPREAPVLAYQQDTLVLREHRGHGLGLALKQANLGVLAQVPDVRRVRTWNAVENAHMLAVNAAMGFRPSGYLREWQKHLR